ncbi:MAG: iron-containing alcohol dehydrogenase family protein [Vicinamibacterales bacterium]
MTSATSTTPIAFTFAVRTNVTFAVGSRHSLSSIVTSQGWREVGLVVDHGVRDVPAVRELIDEVSRSAATRLAWCEISEPTYDSLDEMRWSFEGARLDAVIGIGGGSALDAAKAMAVFVNNHAPALAYRGFDRFTAPVVPIVAVPTTAGTGSEVTPNASFIDSHERRKLGINGEAVRPAFALLDPELTLTCPRLATLSAAADSLVHATEAYVARKTTPMARMFAREGFGRVFNALPATLADGSDVDARTEVMFGAFLAGVALMHSGTGPAAAMLYPIGVHHGVPHGIGGAMFLPAVAEHNVNAGYYDYADLEGLMDGASASPSRQERARHFVEQVNAAWRAFVMPSLGDYGVRSEHLQRLVADTLQLRGALDQNPVPFDAAEIDKAFRSRIAES